MIFRVITTIAVKKKTTAKAVINKWQIKVEFAFTVIL